MLMYPSPAAGSSPLRPRDAAGIPPGLGARSRSHRQVAVQPQLRLGWRADGSRCERGVFISWGFVCWVPKSSFDAACGGKIASVPTEASTARTNAAGLFHVTAFVGAEFRLFHQIHSLQRWAKWDVVKPLLYVQTHTWCMLEEDCFSCVVRVAFRN